MQMQLFRDSKGTRIGFLAILSTFALVVSLFTFTGTAFAHSTSPQSVDPQLNGFVISVGGTCANVSLGGQDFSRSHGSHHRYAEIRAFAHGFELEVDPSTVRLNSQGGFSKDVSICGIPHIRFCDDEPFSIQCKDCDNMMTSNPNCFRFEHVGVSVFAEDLATGETSNSFSFTA